MVNEETEALLSRGTQDEQVRRSVTSTDAPIDVPEYGWDNPRGWSAPFKWGVVALLSFLAFNITFACIAVVPIADFIVIDLNHGGFNESAGILLVTIWELGEAVGPLLFAPLSEIFGRYLVLNSANALFVFAMLLGATCRTTAVFIIARALGGFAVASSVLNPSIIGDIFGPGQHGSALTFVMMTPLVGSAVGPVVGGAMGERFGWRQVIWTCVVLAGVCQILLLTYFKETCKVEKYQDKTTDRKEKVSDSVWVSATRPARLLWGSKVLMLLCTFHAIAFAIYYIMAVTLTGILKDVYGQSTTQAGSCFLLFTIGTGISLSLCKLTIEKCYNHLRTRNDGVGQPEYWLPWTVGGALALPAIIMLYGWAAQLHLPLPIFLLCLVLLGMALSLASLPMFAFIVEAFGTYSASAMAGVIVTRCLAGVFMPLLVAPLIRNLGYGWSFTLVGAAAGCVAPIPALVMRYGGKWRHSSTQMTTEYSRDV